MQFEVDPRSPVTPSEQLADQVRFAVASGRLAQGAQLPTVREVARAARVNPNTVSRAWRELEHDGVLESRRGSGMFVATGAEHVARAFRSQAVSERLGRAVAEALAAGMRREEIEELVALSLMAWPRQVEPENTVDEQRIKR